VELKLPKPDIKVEVKPVAGGAEVIVMAKSFLKDLCLLVDRLDPAAVVDSMLITLLPGESHVFRVQTERAIAPTDIMPGVVLRCANDLVA
jgi:beta-mannosidase